MPLPVPLSRAQKGLAAVPFADFRRRRIETLVHRRVRAILKNYRSRTALGDGLKAPESSPMMTVPQKTYHTPTLNESPRPVSQGAAAVVIPTTGDLAFNLPPQGLSSQVPNASFPLATKSPVAAPNMTINVAGSLAHGPWLQGAHSQQPPRPNAFELALPTNGDDVTILTGADDDDEPAGLKVTNVVADPLSSASHPDQELKAYRSVPWILDDDLRAHEPSRMATVPRRTCRSNPPALNQTSRPVSQGTAAVVPSTMGDLALLSHGLSSQALDHSPHLARTQRPVTAPSMFEHPAVALGSSAHGPWLQAARWRQRQLLRQANEFEFTLPLPLPPAQVAPAAGPGAGRRLRSCEEEPFRSVFF